MTSITPAQRATLDEAEQSEAAALSLRKQAEAFEAEALALRESVYAEWDAVPPVVVPPIPPIDPPPVDPVEPIEPPVYDVLPAFKSGAPGAWSVYDLTGKRFDVQLNLRRLSFVYVTGGTYETADTSFYCDGGSDIIVEAATFTGTPLASINVQRCRVINSTRVYLRDCIVIGGLATTGIPQDQAPPLDATGNVLGLGTGEGVSFYNCTDCGLSDSDVSLCHQGVTFSKSTLAITDNFVHDNRTSPFSGSPRSGMLFAGNRTIAGNAWQWGVKNGDHADACHFFTDGSGDVDGMIFEYNVFEQGDGSPTLGVNHQSKTVNGVYCGYTNLQARRNTINIANGQGWRVDGVSGLIEDTVLLWPGDHADPKSEPRLDCNAPSHDLAINNTKGIVTVDAGLVNITIDGVLQ